MSNENWIYLWDITLQHKIHNNFPFTKILLHVNAHSRGSSKIDRLI